jgi:hypothetical protein
MITTMDMPLSKLEKRIRRAAIMIFIALVGTLGSLLVSHPLSFIEFAIVGVLLIILAIIYYLIALVRGGGHSPDHKHTPPVL